MVITQRGLLFRCSPANICIQIHFLFLVGWLFLCLTEDCAASNYRSKFLAVFSNTSSARSLINEGDSYVSKVMKEDLEASNNALQSKLELGIVMEEPSQPPCA